MKIWSDGGKLTVQAESIEDIATLMSVAGAGTVVHKRGPKKDLIDVEVKPHGNKGKKHKKHNFKKECDMCGRFFKGTAGLSRHKSRTHGIKSANLVEKEEVLRVEGALPAVPVTDEVVAG